MRNRTIGAVLVMAASAFPLPLPAQTVDDGGLSVGAGVGAGWVRVSCDICQTSRELGPSALVRVGTAVRPGVRVAAEATAWTREFGEERENLGAAMAVVYVRPGQSAVHVKGGVGYVGYRAGDDIALNAVGVQLGAGYELRLGGVALSNFANLIGSSFGRLKNQNTTIAEDVSATMLQFGVGLTLR